MRATSLDLRLLNDSVTFGYFRQPVVRRSGTFVTLRLKTWGRVLRRRTSGFRGCSRVYGTPGLDFGSCLALEVPRDLPQRPLPNIVHLGLDTEWAPNKRVLGFMFVNERASA